MRNTFRRTRLPALESAWRRGIAHVEFDVQLSADGVPFVIHDAGLERTTRCAGDVRLMMSGQLDGIDAGEPARFGRAHAGTALPRLSAVAELMAGLPEARAFVEVKRASLVHHGRAHCIERVLAAIAPVLERCAVISFDADAVPPRARDRARCRSAGCSTPTRCSCVPCSSSCIPSTCSATTGGCRPGARRPPAPGPGSPTK